LTRSTSYIIVDIPVIAGNIIFTVGVAYIQNCLETKYADEPFVRVIKGEPNIKDVVGTNFCLMTAKQGRTSGRAVLVSVIDNLCKGASGQAVQNLNIVFGFDEKEGLELAPLFP
jgi:N-acetyl-gamma-glutamyl-phosphate reductase